jgi:DNA-directed RNA polymerase specialized sigma24 family protein
MQTNPRWLISTALQSGARHCFGTYAELHLLVSSLADRLIPAWLLDRRDDVVQDSMIRMMHAVARGGDGSGYSRAYVRRVVYCVVLDAGRRRRREREVPFTTGKGATRIVDIDALDLPARVQGGLRALSPDRRRAVEAYLLGYRPAEIARLAGWSPKRAENLTYRGLADLRRALFPERQLGIGESPDRLRRL